MITLDISKLITSHDMNADIPYSISLQLFSSPSHIIVSCKIIPSSHNVFSIIYQIPAVFLTNIMV